MRLLAFMNINLAADCRLPERVLMAEEQSPIHGGMDMSSDSLIDQLAQ
jgi:hypothetical protein